MNRTIQVVIKWTLKFRKLKVIGNNQKYDFSSQLSIYNKEPEARDCTTFYMWKKYFGRVVKRVFQF